MRRALLLVVLACGCRPHRMSADDCRAVLDRIVDLELAESGYRDPVLAARRKAELRARFVGELAACGGRRVRADALACVQAAPSAEELSHRCLSSWRSR